MTTAPGEDFERYEVAFFLVPGYSMMALSAALEPLRALNRLVGARVYDWRIVARAAGPVPASNGLVIEARHGIDDAPESDLTIVVASLEVEGYHDPAVFQWLRRRRGAGLTVGAVSNGTIILARAGLLRGSRATIHWEMQRVLVEEFPDVAVVPDLYCIDAGVLTAAGGSAAMDLMLALIARREGGEVAADVAEQFLHGPIRDPCAVQRRDIRWRYQVTDRRLLQALRLMEENLETPFRIARLAGLIGMSERQMERLFEDRFNLSPSEFYMHIRLKAARELLLNSTDTLAEISDLCGFSSPAHFSRAFRVKFGAAPFSVRKGCRAKNVGSMQVSGGSL